MKRNRWTPEEIKNLRLLYPYSPIHELKGLLSKHTEVSIRKKAEDLEIRKEVLPWNKGLHGDPRSKSCFKKGHPSYRKDAWTEAEVAVLKDKYALGTKEEILQLLPMRTWGSIHAKARKLGLPRDKVVHYKAAGKGIRENYLRHPERKEKLRQIGLKLAQSPFHHRRVHGEYTLPPASRDKISATLKKTYKEHPEVKKAACASLEKGRLTMGLGKGPTKPERHMASILESLGMKAIAQYRCNGFFLDFALPEQKLAILVDGCFWHCCPTHFLMAATPSQQHTLAIDKKRDRILKKAGWRTLHIWECEVNKSATLKCLKKEVMPNAYPAD